MKKLRRCQNVGVNQKSRALEVKGSRLEVRGMGVRVRVRVQVWAGVRVRTTQ